MAGSRPNPESVRQLLRLAGQAPGGIASDRELLNRFVQDRSEAAFADLMVRHGPMVLGVCRRVLRDSHLADDAFQATFLVLARKAKSVQWRESIAGWLFEAASRVAKKVAAQAARRQVREGMAAASVPEPTAAPPRPAADLADLQTALDDELRRLPERLRVPVVLCHLEGLAQDDVANHLGITDGQLRGRLYRAKEKLRKRLTRRGFNLTAVLLALAVAPSATAIPPVLAASTLRMSGPHASIPDAILHTINQVIRDMSHSIPTLAAAAVVVALGLGAGGFAVRNAVADSPPATPTSTVQNGDRLVAPLPPPPAIVKRDDDKKPDEKEIILDGRLVAVDAAKTSITVKMDDEGGAEVKFDTSKFKKMTFGGKPIQVAQLKLGMHVDLVVPPKKNDPEEARFAWSKVEVSLATVDVAKGRIAFKTDDDDDKSFEVSLDLPKDAVVIVDSLPAGLDDVIAGRKAKLDLTLDKKAVSRIEVDGDKGDVPATILKYDAAAGSLTVEVTVATRDVERKLTLSFPVNADAKVRHLGKDIKLTDLKEGMQARLRMTADRKAVAGLLVADPLPKDTDDDDDK